MIKPINSAFVNYSPNGSKKNASKQAFGANLNSNSDLIRFAIVDAYRAKFPNSPMLSDSKGFMIKLKELFRKETNHIDGEATLFPDPHLYEIAKQIKGNVILLSDKEALNSMDAIQNAGQSYPNKNLLGVLFVNPTKKSIPSEVKFNAGDLIDDQGNPTIKPIIDTLADNYRRIHDRLMIVEENYFATASKS